MNNNNFSQITGQQTMTSMDIAEITGKNHADVMRAIRKMEPAWENVRQSKFALTQRDVIMPTGGHRKDPMYVLTKTECLFVATKFNDEARAKLVLRWEQLEKERLSGNNQPLSDDNRPLSESNLPVDPRNMSRLQILQLALQAEEENERLRAEKQELEAERAVMQDGIRSLEADKYGLMIENGQKDEEIRQLEERVSYLAVIMSDTTAVTVSQIAQDYGMGAPSFNKLLNGLGIQRKVGGQWILYSEHLNRGYVATRMIPIHHAGRPDTFNPLTTWTQAGRKFLYDRLKKNGVLPVIERGQLSVK